MEKYVFTVVLRGFVSMSQLLNKTQEQHVIITKTMLEEKRESN